MIGNRITQIIKESGLKKVEFAKALNVDQSYVSRLASGEKVPSDRLVDDICERFLVNKEWLVYGTGDMHCPAEDERAAYVSDLLEGEDDEFYDIIMGIMKTYSELGEKEKQVLRSFAKSFIQNIKEQD